RGVLPDRSQGTVVHQVDKRRDALLETFRHNRRSRRNVQQVRGQKEIEDDREYAGRLQEHSKAFIHGVGRFPGQ
ncbi:MAG: hypothetical protein OEY60_16315, partial [Nitrospira sp.]|nr:hypothetical protein [Nitrospira sp.]